MLVVGQGCTLFRKSGAAASTSGAVVGNAPSESASAPVFAPLLETPSWKSLGDPSFIGLPQGCVLGTALRKTAMPAGTMRFFAPPNGSELAVAIDTDGNESVERAGILDADGRTGAAVPWTALGSPPVLARTTTRFATVVAEDARDGRRKAVLTTASGHTRTLVEGDHLDVADAACDGSTCAVLTSFASTNAGPGATLLVGDPANERSVWKR